MAKLLSRVLAALQQAGNEDFRRGEISWIRRGERDSLCGKRRGRREENPRRCVLSRQFCAGALTFLRAAAAFLRHVEAQCNCYRSFEGKGLSFVAGLLLVLAYVALWNINSVDILGYGVGTAKNARATVISVRFTGRRLGRRTK